MTPIQIEKEIKRLKKRLCCVLQSNEGGGGGGDIPSVTDHAGEFLGNDGTDLFWLPITLSVPGGENLELQFNSGGSDFGGTSDIFYGGISNGLYVGYPSSSDPLYIPDAKLSVRGNESVDVNEIVNDSDGDWDITFGIWSVDGFQGEGSMGGSLQVKQLGSLEEGAIYRVSYTITGNATVSAGIILGDGNGGFIDPGNVGNAQVSGEMYYIQRYTEGSSGAKIQLYSANPYSGFITDISVRKVTYGVALNLFGGSVLDGTIFLGSDQDYGTINNNGFFDFVVSDNSLNKLFTVDKDGNVGIGATPSSDQLLIVSDGGNALLGIGKSPTFLSYLQATDSNAASVLTLTGDLVGNNVKFDITANDSLNGPISIVGDAQLLKISVNAEEIAINGNQIVDIKGVNGTRILLDDGNTGNILLSPVLGSKLIIANVLPFADNADAISAGLTVGMVYRISTGGTSTLAIVE